MEIVGYIEFDLRICEIVIEDLCNGQHTSSNVAMTFMFNSASNDE